MEYREYIQKIKELYDLFLQYIDSESDSDQLYKDLITSLPMQEIQKDIGDLQLFLNLIVHISCYRYRNFNFFEKIQQVLLFLKDTIKSNFKIKDIFNTFKQNNILLRFVYEKGILQNDQIYEEIKYQENAQNVCYIHILCPQKYEEQIKRKYNLTLDEFNSRILLGENDSYICSLIRNNIVDKFVQYITQTNTPLSSWIKPSIFETNKFLISTRNVSLIQYAAFCGSFNILYYLQMNGIELNSSIWPFAIHGRNEQLIHFIEEKKIDPQYNLCLTSAIKFHHNDIVEYIGSISNEEPKLTEVIQFYNFPYLPDELFETPKLLIKELFMNHYINILKMNIEYGMIQLQDILTINLYSTNANVKNITKFFFEEGGIEFKKINFFDQIVKLTIPSNIKVIGSFSFSFLDYLEDIIIPANVTEIKKSAFQNCKGLKHVSILSSITSINENVFSDCPLLTQINIPNSVTRIHSSAFSSCNSLEEIEIPSSVTKIDKSAFVCCNKLKKIVIPSSITELPEFCFARCNSLYQVTIPSTVTVIENNCFKDCKSLKEITLPSSMTVIKDSCFYGCSSLEEITIPSLVTKIESHAFENCTSLKKITLPISLKEVGSGIFDGVISLTIISDLRMLPSNMFFRCQSIKKIVLSPSIIGIDDKFFNGCESLEEIVFPTNLISIGDEVFTKCNKLKFKAVIPPDLINIGNASFNGFPYIEIANGNKAVLPNQFINCTTLKEVIIPPSVTLISTNAFNGCSLLESISIPSSVTKIEVSSFERCMALKEIVIPSSVKIIERNTFYKCTSLVSISIPSSVILIEDSAFSKCISLQEIKIPSSVTEIGSKTFFECSELEQVDFDDDSSLEKIGDYAFALCTNLSQIKIPSSVKSMDNSVFYKCLSFNPSNIRE